MNEPTGKRRGRPPKPRDPNPPPSRGRGRPEGSVKLLSGNPQRYLYAFAEMTIQKSRVLGGPSELKICETLATLWESRPLRVGESIIGQDNTLVTDDFEERWRHHLSVPFVSRKWDEMLPHVRAFWRSEEPGASWRGKNKVRPAADNIGRTLRLLRNAPPMNPNRRWLDGMTKVMLFCFNGEIEHAGLAESIAAEIGETGYFAAKLRPLMIRYAEFRSAGVSSPDPPPLFEIFDLIFPS